MPMFESSRKVQVFGTSLAITLPALFVKIRDIEKGSVMDVFFGLDGVLVVSDLEDPETLKKSLIAIIDNLDEKTVKRRKRVNDHKVRVRSKG